MEALNANESNITSKFNDNTMANNLFEISSNWLAVEGNRKLENVISCQLSVNSPLRMTLDDIVDEKGCLEIRPTADDNGGCTIEIKMKDKYKIVRIGVVSEASILEIFRDAGEYAATIFADFIDEFEDSSVYYAETTFDRPTTETSIKFRRIKNNRTTMFLYGVRIIVEEVTMKNPSEELLDFNLISNLLKMTMGNCKKNQKNDECQKSHINKIGDSSSKNFSDYRENMLTENINKQQDQMRNCIQNQNDGENNSNANFATFESSINIQLQKMEQRIMDRINLFEENTNKKLDEIIVLLELKQ
ncbi:hypothetical protein PV327_006227 [Microctonus hyperodae]|uniref:Uncharacterized protein n=1 Tax=Microctonus hyperodae TaxID=165561 RepID=A0AA39F3V9_MICHY|nr:hypothetical protein PV327_006227 [Microctonus hyperodae]